MELAKQAGAKRAIRLPGAFHSPLMQSAWQAFAQTLSHAPITIRPCRFTRTSTPNR